MSDKFKGVVLSVSDKNGKYSIKGDDNRWYGCWTNNPGNIEGKTVEFEYKVNGNFFNANVKSIKVLDSSAPSVSSPAAAKRTFEPRRDCAIQIQGCRNTAVAFVKMCLDAGAVPLPTKKGDQLEALDALVEIYTNKFYVRTDKVQESGGIPDDTLVEAVENNNTNEEDF